MLHAFFVVGGGQTSLNFLHAAAGLGLDFKARLHSRDELVDTAYKTNV
jgi:hypothetical protein